jgi:hypothetical protein
MSLFYRNYYSTIQQQTENQRRWFDEGPIVYKNVIGTNTSSINTSAVDKFRQGVEITQNKHTQTGVYKITAGTPGHIVNPNSIGVTNLDILSENYFKDLVVFEPAKYLQAQQLGLDLEKMFVFPIISKDANQADNYDLNGIIEPLSIRSVASFFSIEFPFESHATRGTMMGGNTDLLFGSSDMVLTVDYYPKRLTPTKQVGSGSLTETKDYRSFVNSDYFLDAQEPLTPVSGGYLTQNTSYLDTRLNVMDSFDDSRTYLSDIGLTAARLGQDMLSALGLMTASLDNYVAPKKRSATAGFVYDGVAGTDSIAFGGLEY